MIEITGTGLRLEQVVEVARLDAIVSGLVPAARARMDASLSWVDGVLSGDQTVYGINTGFGSLASTCIDSSDASQLSRNVIVQCCVGVGPPLPHDVVRAMMVIRADTLAHGWSGVRPVLIDTLIAMLNAGVTPLIPSKGSLGASGDLAPLAHIAVVMTRDPEGSERPVQSGQAWFDGELLSGEEAMRRAGIERVVPGPKEGLALTNGTTFMLAAAVLAVCDAENLLDHADAAAALSLEALQALSAAFDPSLHAACCQPGQEDAAARLRALFGGSRLIDSDGSRIQDAYSLRCIPQVHGPVRDAVEFIRSRVESLLAGSSDNPLVFVSEDGSGRAVSGGNFHGQGLAFWHDMMGIVMAEIASLSERRTFRLLTPELSGGLPAMLVPNPGVDGGLMMVQYTQAALVADNKVLAHPDSVDSIPSSANQEDHVSMGANAARHAREILDNVRHVLAIELLTAAQGVDLRPDGPARLGKGTSIVHAEVRRCVEMLVHDRALTDDIHSLTELIRSDSLRQAIQAISNEAD